MKRVHIIGSARTGTTLMLELFINGYELDGYASKEQSVLKAPNPIRSGVYCSKDVTDTGMARTLLRCDPNLWMVYMERDPRDVIASRHGKQPDLYWSNLGSWRRAQRSASKVANHPRFVTVRYEELVARPDDIQQELARRIPFLEVKAAFSTFHLTANTSEESSKAMRGVRPVSPATVGAWRDHKPRVVGQMNRYGSLDRELIELGYEPDDAWLEGLKGVEPDDRPGFLPEHVRRRHKFRRASAQWILVPRLLLLRRLPVRS